MFMMLGLATFMIMSSVKFSGSSRLSARISEKRLSCAPVGRKPSSSSQAVSSQL